MTRGSVGSVTILVVYDSLSLIFLCLLKHISEGVVEGGKILVVLDHGFTDDVDVGVGDDGDDGGVSDGSVFTLVLSVDLKEKVLDLFSKGRKYIVVKSPEGVERPGLLVVSEVFDGKVVTEGERSLLNYVRTASAGGDIRHHLGKHSLGVSRGDLLSEETGEGLTHDGLVPFREEFAVGLAKGHVNIDPIFTSEGLDEVLEGDVPTVVVGAADGHLHPEDCRREGGVEGLEIVGEFVKDSTEFRLPSSSVQVGNVVVEATKSLDALPIVELSFEGLYL